MEKYDLYKQNIVTNCTSIFYRNQNKISKQITQF